MLMATSGLAYLAAAWIFRIPMPVQPLKAIAVAALATGASSLEIQISGALLGLFCLALSVPWVERLARKIPVSLIHALQLGLGIILIRQGIRFGFMNGDGFVQEGWTVASTMPSKMPWTIALTFFLLVGVLLSRMPILGFAATVGLAWAVFMAEGQGEALDSRPMTAPETLRLSLIASLVFPQLALTFFNSVLGTRNAAVRYFGEKASRVSVSRLLRSIGVGNLLFSLAGGLPFCHGSGGLTSHYRGGARHWIANVFIGVTLLIFALFQSFRGNLSLHYPVPLLASLLMTVGFFHLLLAKPTWETAGGKMQIIACGIIAVWTQNMLWVLGAACAIETMISFKRRNARIQTQAQARAL